jgi:hypothetical protein
MWNYMVTLLSRTLTQGGSLRVHQAMMVDLTDISDEQQGSPLDRYITSYAAGAASTAKVDTLSEVSVCPCCGAHDL